MPFVSGGSSFNGGTITAPLTITDASGGSITLSATNGIESDPSAVSSNPFASFPNQATGDLLHLENDLSAALSVSTDGSVTSLGSVFAALGLNTGLASVPADNTLGNSQAVLWIDATPAATKLMVKAKDSGGTVRTASIALA